MLLCRRRSDRSRDRGQRSTRDRSRDRGHPHRHSDKSRQGDRRNERHPRAQAKDGKGSQNDRRGHRGPTKDADRGRDNRRGGEGGSQQRDARGKEEYTVNAWGVVVSPDNVQRAKNGRQVRTVKGEWLSARDSGNSHSILGLITRMTHKLKSTELHTTKQEPDYMYDRHGRTRSIEHQ